MTSTDQTSEIHSDATDQGDGEGIDPKELKEILGFIRRAAGRRPMLAAGVFFVIAALGVTISATMPRIYNAQVKMLAQNDVILTALSNPSRAVPRDADNPTHNVIDTIMRRDNLVALVKEGNLLEKWRSSRSPALRFKDRVFTLLFGAGSEEDELVALAQTLEKRLTVMADESTVTISVDWNEPRTTYELVQLLQKNFVEARYDSEVAKIQDAISVLEEHSKAELEQVDGALAAYRAIRGSDLSPDSPAVSTTPTSLPVRRAMGPAPAAPMQAATAPVVDADLTKALEDKRREIRALEDSRQRTLNMLKEQLVQAQLTLTAMHPTVIALQQKIDALSEPPPELSNLKNEERALMNQIAPPTMNAAPPADSLATNGPVVRLQRSTALAAQRPDQQDPSLVPARSRLDAAIYRYQTTTANIESAKLELEITRAAFKHRYTVMTPAEFPRRPKRPIAFLVGLGSLLSAMILGVLAAAAADWRGGRVLETWQVRRRLKLEVLGEFDPPL